MTNKYDALRDAATEFKLNLSDGEREKRAVLGYDKLEAMKSGAHTRIPIEFDGILLTLRLITVQERQMATDKAAIEWGKKPEIARWSVDLELLRMLHILYYALSPCPEQVYDGKGPFTLKQLNFMTENQIYRLYELWCDIDREYNPCVDDLSEEAFNEMLDEVVKKPDLILRLSLKQLERLSTYFVLREQAILKDK